MPIREVIGRKDLRNYKDAVKIFRLPNGNARVTEKDGDQWEVNAAGTPKPITRDPQRGTIPNRPVSSTYTSDKGEEQVYWAAGMFS